MMFRLVVTRLRPHIVHIHFLSNDTPKLNRTSMARVAFYLFEPRCERFGLHFGHKYFPSTVSDFSCMGNASLGCTCWQLSHVGYWQVMHRVLSTRAKSARHLIREQPWQFFPQYQMAPPWGLSAPRTRKTFFQNFKKVIWSRNMCFSYGFPPYFACAKL